MPQVVQPDPRQAGAALGEPPLVADGVLVRRVSSAAGEQPVRDDGRAPRAGAAAPPARRASAPTAPSRTSAAGSRPPRRRPAAPAGARAAGAAGSRCRRTAGRPPRPAAARPARRPRRTRGTARRPRPGTGRPPAGWGSCSASARLRCRGSRTPSVGSTPITRSRTAARNTDRTLTNRVLTVPGASGRPLGGRRGHRLHPGLDMAGADRAQRPSTGTAWCAPPAHRDLRVRGPHLPRRPRLEEVLEVTEPAAVSTQRPGVQLRVPDAASAAPRPSCRRCAGAGCPVPGAGSGRATGRRAASPTRPPSQPPGHPRSSMRSDRDDDHRDRRGKLWITASPEGPVNDWCGPGTPRRSPRGSPV